MKWYINVTSPGIFNMDCDRSAMNRALKMHRANDYSSDIQRAAGELLDTVLRVQGHALEAASQRDLQCCVTISSANGEDLDTKCTATLPLALPHHSSDMGVLFLEISQKFPHIFSLSSEQMSEVHKKMKTCVWKDGHTIVDAGGLDITLHRRDISFDDGSFNTILQYGESLDKDELRQHLTDITNAASGVGMLPYLLDVRICRNQPVCVRVVCTAKAFCCKHIALSVVGIPSVSEDYTSCKKIHVTKSKCDMLNSGCLREADLLTQCAPIIYQHTSAVQSLIQQASTISCSTPGMHEATLLQCPDVLQPTHPKTFGDDLSLIDVSNTCLTHIVSKLPISLLTCTFRMFDAQGSPHSVRVTMASLLT